MIFSCLWLFSPLYLLFYSSLQVFSRHSLISVDLLCGWFFCVVQNKVVDHNIAGAIVFTKWLYIQS
jgi:hypothetical protein